MESGLTGLILPQCTLYGIGMLVDKQKLALAGYAQLQGSPQLQWLLQML